MFVAESPAGLVDLDFSLARMMSSCLQPTDFTPPGQVYGHHACQGVVLGKGACRDLATRKEAGDLHEGVMKSNTSLVIQSIAWRNVCRAIGSMFYDAAVLIRGVGRMDNPSQKSSIEGCKCRAAQHLQVLGRRIQELTGSQRLIWVSQALTFG